MLSWNAEVSDAAGGAASPMCPFPDHAADCRFYSAAACPRGCPYAAATPVAGAGGERAAEGEGAVLVIATDDDSNTSIVALPAGATQDDYLLLRHPDPAQRSSRRLIVNGVLGRGSAQLRTGDAVRVVSLGRGLKQRGGDVGEIGLLQASLSDMNPAMLNRERERLQALFSSSAATSL